MQRRTVLTFLLAATLVVPLAADAQKPIKVGMPMPLSGPPALFGEPATKGAMMFVEEINAKGGVLGRKLGLITGASRAAATRAVRQPGRLFSRATADFLVARLPSAEDPASPVAARRTRSALLRR